MIKLLVRGSMVFMVAAVCAAAQDSAGLRDACDRAIRWESYQATLEEIVEEESDGQGQSSTDRFEIVFEKDKGLSIKHGRRLKISVGDKSVTQNRDGTWKLGKPGSGDKAPHLVFDGLASTIADLSSAREDKGVIYTGTPDLAGATALLAGNFKDVTTKGVEPELKCSAKFTVDGDGAIAKVVVTCSAVRKSRNSETSVKVTRTLAFSQINATKLQIPEEASQLLNQGQ